MSIGQMPTPDYVGLFMFTARPYPNTNVSIRFQDGTTKDGKVVRDDDAPPGAQNIMVKYNDGTEQRFTKADEEAISIKIGQVESHYRGGRKRKTRRNKKNKKSRKGKSRRR